MGMMIRGGAVARSATGGVARAIERVLWLTAALCLGTVAVVQTDAWVYQKTARLPAASERVAAGAVRHEPIPPGAPVARLLIPRLDVDVVVAEGTADAVLRRAAGRLAASARPGEEGNIVIAGHRDTFFRPLEEIRAGDLIVLDSGAGRLHYRVEWMRIVEPDDVGVLDTGGSDALTLVTCYPFRYVGNAPKRFVVRAREQHS